MTGYLAFDIETTGLNAPECEVVSWCLGETTWIQTDIRSEGAILNILDEINKRDIGILTFNGGTMYNPGFDFPFLRTRCAILGAPWPFAGIPHIDIYPIIQKRFDTKISFLPELSELTVDELKLMMKSLNIVSKAKKKQEYIDAITGLSDPLQVSEYIQDNCKMKTKEVNNLKGAYELLTGDASGDMRGDDVPRLWSAYKVTGDAAILESIKEYNRADCEKVEVLWELIQQCVPSRDLMPEVL